MDGKVVYQSNVNAGHSEKLIWTNQISKQDPFTIWSNICKVLSSLHVKGVKTQLCLLHSFLCYNSKLGHFATYWNMQERINMKKEKDDLLPLDVQSL